MSPAIEVSGLCAGFDVPSGFAGRRRYARVIDRLDLTISQGEAVGLVGESGSGKSTAARAMLRLLPVESGSIALDGVDVTTLSERRLRSHRLRAQMVFQDPYSSLDPGMRIEQVVGEPLTLVRGSSAAARRARVIELLGRVGLGDSVLDRYPHEFSGGQRQRIAIARALAPSPALLVCDEAVSALDVSTQNQIIGLLRELRRELGVAMLFISHDLAVVRQLTERTVVMYCGQVVEEGPTDAIFGEAAHPYTLALLSAAPVPSPRRQRQREQIVLAGDVPNPLDPPTGCRFHERCPYAWEKCREVEPVSVQVGIGRTVRCHLHSDGTGLPGAVPSAEPARSTT